MTIVLDRAAKLAWLRLARTPQIGPVTFASLIARFGTAERALEEIPHLAQRGGAKSFVLPPKEDIARELDLLEAIGGRMIASCETAFPPGLTALDPPPPVISLFGQAHLLQQDMVAVVGARNASALARKFAWSLSSRPAWRAASTRRPMKRRWTPGPSRSWRAVSISFIRPKTKVSIAPSRSVAWSCPRCGLAKRRRRVTFPVAIA
jgi:hypothetical protein